MKDLDAPTFTAVFGLMTVVVVVVGYSIGRAHAAWQSVGLVKRRVKAARYDAWSRVRHAVALILLLLLLLAAMIRSAFS